MRFFFQKCYDDHFSSSSSSTTTSEERKQCVQPLQVAVQKEGPALHTARMIILYEQEKALFVAQHPELDQYLEGEAQQKLVELATEVSKWRQVYQEKMGRWFQGYGEGLKVTSSPHFAEEHRDEFHVACFFMLRCRRPRPARSEWNACSPCGPPCRSRKRSRVSSTACNASSSLSKRLGIRE